MNHPRNDAMTQSRRSLPIVAGLFLLAASSPSVGAMPAGDCTWSTDQLSVARSEASAAGVDGLVLVAGGWSHATWTASPVIDVYNACCDEWTVAQFPDGVGCYQMATTTVRGQVLFIAGLDGADGDNDAVDLLRIYDSNTLLPPDDPSAWLPSLQVAIARRGMTAASIDKWAIIAGGGDSFGGPGTGLDIIEVYDSEARTLVTSAALLSDPRTYAASTTVGPYVIVAGGLRDNESKVAVDFYDLGLGEPVDAAAWSPGQNLSEARYGAVAVTVGDYALFAGGNWIRPGSDPSDVVDIYHCQDGSSPDDPAAWSAFLLSVPRRNLTATVTGPLAVFAGGVDDLGSESDVVDVYDSRIGAPDDPAAWSTCSLSVGRSGLASATACGKLVFAGGTMAFHVESDAVDILELGCGVTSYCQTSPNSVGDGAVISHAGIPSIEADDFTLIASECPPCQFGLFFYGESQLSVPFGEGLRCVGGPALRRLSVVNTGSEGVAAQPLDYSTKNPSLTIEALSTWNFQFWYRDGATFNLSDALEVTFCP